MRPRPEPQSPTDLRHWANLFTRARLRKGWSYQRLACEAGISLASVERACSTGRSSTDSALKLASALGLMLVLPPTPVLSGHQAQRG
jgi:transcriptional regulator with XRE-family HTH domain